MSGDLRGAEDLNRGEIEVAPEVRYLTHKYTNMEDDLLETTTMMRKLENFLCLKQLTDKDMSST